MSATEELGQYLVDQGIGTALYDDVWPDWAPATTDSVVVVYPLKGRGPVDAFGTTTPLMLRPDFQIMSRAATLSEAKSTAAAAWTALHNTRAATLQGARGAVTTQATYHHIRCRDDEPIQLMPDEETRFLYVFNIEVDKTVSVAV